MSQSIFMLKYPSLENIYINYDSSPYLILCAINKIKLGKSGVSVLVRDGTTHSQITLNTTLHCGLRQLIWCC